MRAKIAFCCLVPFLLCLGIFIGDAITARFTPVAKATNVLNPQWPCATLSATTQAFHDSMFPARERYITFKVTGACDDNNGFGCTFKVYQTIWKLTPRGYDKVYEGWLDKGAECGENGTIQWTDDFAVWGEALYKIDLDRYDTLPIWFPTPLGNTEYSFAINY